MKMVALIPARAGSKRCPGKNTRLLAGHPLIAYTIAAALESGVFADVCVVTEDDGIARTAMQCGNVRVMARSAATATDEAPDVLWVREFFEHNRGGNAFAILRPTSPFRTAETIQRAYNQFTHDEAHSLRAVQPAREHPGKMWTCDGPGYPIVPVLDRTHADGTPWHSSPTQTLPTVYVQNASLEMAWTYVITSFSTISGVKVSPFFTTAVEGFDINTEADFSEAERLIATSAVTLPSLHAHA